MKQYISDTVGNDYKSWGKNEKVFIFAQTGRGKTRFIMEEAAPYWLECGYKVLILVNRRSLLKQYVYEKALKYEQYEPDIHIKTYQEFAGRFKNENTRGWKNAFYEYNVVVLDEVHFFVSDSDFNPADTYIMWQAILHSYGQLMIFMSATPEELRPFLEEYEKHNKVYFQALGVCRESRNKFREYQLDANYDYIRPEIIEDRETMLNLIAKSKKKTVIFLDDIEQGKEIRDEIKSIAENKSIVCWDANSLEENQEADQIMKTLCMANKLECDVLITTSVLDNGVSIHDEDVENIVIFAISRTSFLQMLGRVRTEDIGQLRLLLVPREPEYWERKEKVLEEQEKEIKRLTKGDCYEKECHFLCEAVLNDDRMLELYKKIFVLIPDREDFPVYQGEDEEMGLKVRVGRAGGKRLAINRLAVAKILQMLQTVRRMHALSRRDINAPCHEQLSWIGKKPEDVICRESTYLQEERDKMHRRFLEVQDYGKNEFSCWKKDIAEQFRGTCLKHLNIKSGSPIKEKDLEEILEEHGLKLEKKMDETRQNRYTISEK